MATESRINIERTLENDIPEVVSIENTPAYDGFIEKWSESGHRDAIHSDEMDHFVLRDKASNAVLGYMIFARDGHNLAMMFRRIAVARQREGLGRKAVVFALKYCFESLEYHRLWLNVREDNTAAIRLYERAGFVREGMARDAIRVGPNSYKSYVVMSILQSEYPTRPRPARGES